jgi:hypothetical protein
MGGDYLRKYGQWGPWVHHKILHLLQFVVISVCATEHDSSCELSQVYLFNELVFIEVR